MSISEAIEEYWSAPCTICFRALARDWTHALQVVVDRRSEAGIKKPGESQLKKNSGETGQLKFILRGSPMQ